MNSSTLAIYEGQKLQYDIEEERRSELGLSALSAFSRDRLSYGFGQTKSVQAATNTGPMLCSKIKYEKSATRALNNMFPFFSVNFRQKYVYCLSIAM